MGEGSRTGEVADLLQRCTLFAQLDRADLVRLAEFARRERHPSGKTIFRTGDPGESLMGILVGEVRIVRASEDGEIIITDLKAGDIFGEIAVLDGRDRSADAVAVTNCELVVLERRNLIPFLMQRPELSIELLRLICGKLREADERSNDFLFLNLEARLAKALLRLCGPDKARTSLTQGELAKLVGGTRPNVNRQLKAWERVGVIELRKGWIVLQDRQPLEETAGIVDLS